MSAEIVFVGQPAGPEFGEPGYVVPPRAEWVPGSEPLTFPPGVSHTEPAPPAYLGSLADIAERDGAAAAEMVRELALDLECSMREARTRLVETSSAFRKLLEKRLAEDRIAAREHREAIARGIARAHVIAAIRLAQQAIPTLKNAIDQVVIGHARAYGGSVLDAAVAVNGSPDIAAWRNAIAAHEAEIVELTAKLETMPR